jgi:hypothetical protein
MRVRTLRKVQIMMFATDAERLVAPGAGHFVAKAPGFRTRLEEFLLSAG